MPNLQEQLEQVLERFEGDDELNFRSISARISVMLELLASNRDANYASAMPIHQKAACVQA